MSVKSGKLKFNYNTESIDSSSFIVNDVCRLDFEHFTIAGPEPINHICNTDQFLVSGGSPAPTICGTSHGDHSKCNIQTLA